ncbi:MULTISPECIES: IS3 family transposase [unclassified Bacillus (in: firmicutes)]|uniref:IS3 family transposase n=1 Tax=unclassified Bacillus (in: firmicutes) TaxID=185979 RepID=UPI000E2E9C96|nr:hypothetical protein DZB83_14360 [Bacillus sp. dmp10]HDR6297988.1 IS3 family transposase [Bacillus cereus]HDR8169185.1 IS3 family transposase [Bacillus thuringiensis]
MPCVFDVSYKILTTFKLAISKYIHSYNHTRFQKKKLNNLSPYINLELRLLRYVF